MVATNFRKASVVSAWEEESASSPDASPQRLAREKKTSAPTGKPQQVSADDGRRVRFTRNEKAGKKKGGKKGSKEGAGPSKKQTALWR